MKAQVLYDLRNEMEFCDGEELHDFFATQTGGEPSPSGHVEINDVAAVVFVMERLDNMLKNSPGMESHAEATLSSLNSALKGYYEIQSGMKRGEMYHHEVWVAETEAKAQECLGYLVEKYGEEKDWLWGPHIYPREGDAKDALGWNGFEEVSAPMWLEPGVMMESDGEVIRF